MNERVEQLSNIYKFKEFSHNDTAEAIFAIIEEYFEAVEQTELNLVLSIFHIVALKDAREYPLIYDKDENLKFWEELNNLH